MQQLVSYFRVEIQTLKDVADAFIRLVNLPKPQQPLKTMINASTRHLVSAAEDAVAMEYEKVMTAFNLEEIFQYAKAAHS